MSSIWELRRSATDTKVAGVCGGVAARWGVDPTLVRVGCAVLALCSGVGLVLYAAGWLLLPVEGTDRAPVDDLLGEQARTWPKELWLAVVVLASLLAISLFGKLSFGLGPVMILALLWYFGYYKHRTPTPTPRAEPRAAPAVGSPVSQPFTFPGPPTPFTQAAEAWQQRIADHAAPGERELREPAATPAAGPTAPLPATAMPSERTEDQMFWGHPDPVGLYAEPETPAVPNPHRARPARRLRLVGLVALGLVLTGLGVADLAGVPIPVTTYLAAALLVVGLTLVAATWWGRAAGILPVGLLLALALGVTAGVGLVGDRIPATTRSYAAIAELPPAGDTLDVGRLEVDLSRLPVSRNVRYVAHVDLGSLEVRVPRDVPVRIIYRVAEGGTVLTDDQEVATGANLDDVVEPPDLPPATPVLTVDLSVDRGVIRVLR